MVGWIIQLCALCAMSALLQMILPQGEGREALRMICGLLMLRLTCESAQGIINEITACGSFSQMLACLIK